MPVCFLPGEVSGGNLSKDRTGGLTNSHYLNIDFHSDLGNIVHSVAKLSVFCICFRLFLHIRSFNI